MISINDFEQHEGEQIEIEGDIYEFHRMWDSMGVWGMWESKKFILLTGINYSFSEGMGFGLDVLYEDGSSDGIFASANVNVENFCEYLSLVKIFGKNVIRKVQYADTELSPVELEEIHSEYCNGTLQYGYCVYCGCSIRPRVRVSQFFKDRWMCE